MRLISVDADSREVKNSDVVLPWERRDGVAQAIEVPGSRESTSFAEMAGWSR